jgi:hypothetical protein
VIPVHCFVAKADALIVIGSYSEAILPVLAGDFQH